MVFLLSLLILAASDDADAVYESSFFCFFVWVYSWCHVMEHTTFEVNEAAEVMNKHFVNIKVDREERPDVDKVYMNYVLMTTGHGGWPMSVFLEPSTLAPIFGGTYYSAHGEGRRPGFIKICESIAGQWDTNREKIIKSGATITSHLKAMGDRSIAESEKDSFLQTAGSYILEGAQQRARSFDPVYGGWGAQPKFPQPVILTSLFVAHFMQGKDSSIYLNQCEKTLTQMFSGGIHDHLSGGFHRYSVTEEWKLPHFEKMLYDQAQIATAYLTAYQISKRNLYKDAASDIFKYVATQMTDSTTGGFYSAEDADSPLKDDPSVKREGAFYVWEHEELKSLLNEQELAVLTLLYDLKPHGNVPSEYDPHGELENMNILHTEKNLDQISFSTGLSSESISSIIQASHKKLHDAQSKRPRPHLDDKCVTVWNSMMIQALAKGYQVLGDQTLLDLALGSLNFIRNNLYLPESKQLLRSYREGPSNIDGFAEDYAHLIAALIELYHADFNHKHLQWAIELQETMDRLFWDTEKGGYFCDNGNPDLHLLVRTKDDFDGSEPSYNSVAACSLIQLYNLLHNESYKKRAEDLLAAFANNLSERPLGMPMMTVAAAAYSMPPSSIVIYGDLDSDATRSLVQAARGTYNPFQVVVHASFESESARFFHDQGVVLFKDLSTDLTVKGRPAAYVCQDFACNLPVTDAKALSELLSKSNLQ